MSEQDWFSCGEPLQMLEHLRGKVSDRKFRLFTVGCCRRASEFLNKDKYLPALLTFIEKLSDNEGTEIVLSTEAPNQEGVSRIQFAADAILALAPTVPEGEPDPYSCLRSSLVHRDSWIAAWNTVSAVAFQFASLRDRHGSYQSVLLSMKDVVLDLFSSPFRPPNLDPAWLAWNGGAVRRLVQGIYSDGDFSYMSILADALEDAGCDNVDLLQHCRGESHHFKGCWAIDLLLNKC